MEDFTRGMDKWRQEQLERLAEGKEEYALSQGFIDYAEAFVQYGWAERMITYPAIYRRVNRGENRGITPEYYGFLEDDSLVDERAIGVQNYRPFLVQCPIPRSNDVGDKLSSDVRPSVFSSPSVLAKILMTLGLFFRLLLFPVAMLPSALYRRAKGSIKFFLCFTYSSAL